MIRQLTGRERVLALAGLMLVLFLVSLDQTVVSTAMPRIIADLNGFELYAWVTTAYLLAETTVIPIVGKLGDMYGRKWITVIGVALFVGASAFCGLATSMPWLIVWRGIQGLGGGMLLSTVFALVADIFPNLKDRARYQGILFSVFALSSVVGPVLGGWITDSLNWRWVFYVNLPLGLLALAVLPFVLPQSKRKPNAKIDLAGATLITISVVALLLSVEYAGAGNGWTSPLTLGGLAIAALAFAVFVPVELRAAEPIIPFSLFRNRTFSSIALVMLMVGVAMFGITLYTPLFVQGVLGISASGSGAVMTPMVLTMVVMGIVVGQIIARTGQIKPLLIFGTAMLALGVFLLTTLNVTSSSWLVSVYLFVMALGLGSVMPVTTLAVQNAVDPAMLGVATSSTQFIRSIGATVGTAVIGTIVTGGYGRQLAATAPEGTPQQMLDALHSPNALVNQDALDKLNQLAASLPNSTAIVSGLLDAARAALAHAIQSGFYLVLAAAVIGFGCSFLMQNLRLAEKPATGGMGAPAEAGFTAVERSTGD